MWDGPTEPKPQPAKEDIVVTLKINLLESLSLSLSLSRYI